MKYIEIITFGTGAVPPIFPEFYTDTMDEFIGALLASPDKVGIFKSPSASHAHMTTKIVRGAGVKNFLFVMAEASDESTLQGIIVAALMSGADQAQPIDIDPVLFTSFMKAMPRRGSGNPNVEITMGDLVYNRSTGLMTSCGQPIKSWSKNHTKILDVIINGGGKTVTRDEIYEYLYLYDGPEEKTVDVQVCKVRERLRRFAGREFIATHWGSGYYFVAEGFEVEPYGKKAGARFASPDLRRQGA